MTDHDKTLRALIRRAERIRRAGSGGLAQKERTDAIHATAMLIQECQNRWAAAARRRNLADAENEAAHVVETVWAIAMVQFRQLEIEDAEKELGRSLPAMTLMDRPNSVLVLGNQLLRWRRSVDERTGSGSQRHENPMADSVPMLALAHERDLSDLTPPASESDESVGIDVRNALASLPERSARVAYSRHVEGHQIQEIAKSESLSTKTVRRVLRSAEAALQKHLAAYRRTGFP